MIAMTSALSTSAVSRRLRPLLAAVSLGAAAALVAPPAFARGPDVIADVAGRVIDAVVNVSTTQTVEASDDSHVTPPKLPPGSPFEKFFNDFFKHHHGSGGNLLPRKTASLGSGFIIDPSGIVVTNDHVIEGADQVNVTLNDGTRLKAKIVGIDKKTDLAVLKVKPPHPLTAVKFGDSDKLRLGEWVVAIGNPFSLGGTVTAGIVSAKNRDISTNPYDSYIQTDAAINRGNSGGPLFNLDGDVIGVNTLIISPSGGSIGLGFAIPSNTVAPIVEQLRSHGEVSRGWLGVRIQTVTDEIADSLDVHPPRGALVAGVDDKGPAKPAGIEPGDVVVKFDHKDVKDPRDLSRIVAETAVGKQVDVVLIRKGKEETHKVTVGKLKDDVKVATRTKEEPEEKPVTQKTLGLDLASLDQKLRSRYKIKGKVKGVLITGVDDASEAGQKNLSAGDVIVQVGQEPVNSAADISKRIDQLKKGGHKSVLLLLSNGEGELRFVALSLQ